MKKNLFLLLLAFFPVASLADATPVKLSKLGRSIFFRGGSATRGKAGTNGGHYTDRLFNGNFTDYTYCNKSGTTELVIPTTGLDENDNDTGVAWYVTDFKVGHQGNSKYSLYYTTEAEPANILSCAQDPRTWTPVTGATGIQAAGTKIYGVNTVATAVKYVFDTDVNWGTSLAEVEVWGVDPAELEGKCQHPSYTEWEEVPGSATCTEYGFKRRKCSVCGDVFELDSALPLGHAWESHLSQPGSSSAFGSGTIECSRCGETIVFNIPIDLTTIGGVALPGVVQFADLSVSDSNPNGGGTGPGKMIDGNWTYDWGYYWFPSTRNESEWVEYDFGTEIDLTKIEWSVANHAQTLKFYKWDGETEEPLVEIPVTKDSTDNGYQRGSIEFRGISVKGIRLHIADSIGIQYGGSRFVSVSELHPWGTVIGAGKLDVLRSKILLY